VPLRTKASFCLVYQGGGGCEYRADPVDTRNAIAIALSAALNAPIEAPHYGVFRM
jgi:hypothetical protein